jgi:hypothetical protein
MLPRGNINGSPISSFRSPIVAGIDPHGEGGGAGSAAILSCSHQPIYPATIGYERSNASRYPKTKSSSLLPSPYQQVQPLAINTTQVFIGQRARSTN